VNELEPLSDYQFLAHNQEAKLLLANPLLQKDVWHTIDDLGLIVNPHSQQLTLNCNRSGGAPAAHHPLMRVVTV
jgi:integrase/recombinase XerD